MSNKQITPLPSLSTSPLIPVAICFAAGIAWKRFDYQFSDLTYFMLAAGLAISVFFSYRASAATSAKLLIPALFFLLGVLHAAPLKSPDDPYHIANKIAGRQEVSISGILTETPIIGNRKSRLMMKVETLHRRGKTEPAGGVVQLSMRGRPPETLMPGDRFMARATLSPPRNFGVPGTFDRKSYLASKSIFLTGWVRSPALLMRLHDLSPPPLRHRLHYTPERIRYKINAFLDRALDTRTKGLYKAILIGNKADIPPDLLENFKTAGCVHLLAISGLHIGLLAAFVTAMLHWLLKRSHWLLLHTKIWKLSAFLALLPLTWYAMIAGFHTPVIRALLMTAVFLVAVLVDRQWHIPTNIAVAAILILAWKPASLYTVSFQLSFAAVIAIALIAPRIAPLLVPVHSGKKTPGRHIARLGNWVLAGAVASIAAMLGTLPLLLFYFNRFSPISPLSTLLVEPMVCFWALIFGLAACFMMPVFPWLASKLLQIGALGLTAADKTTLFLASLPGSSIWLPTPFIAEIICFYILLISLLFWKSRRRTAIAAGVAALSLLLAFPLGDGFAKKRDHRTTVSIIDVGQGNANLLELPNGRTILIDGGGPASPGFNVGERVVAPFLWKKRISHLDQVVISHPHADHFNGLFFILQQFRPSVLWINGRKGDEREYEALIQTAKQLGIEIQVPKAGTYLFNNGKTGLQNIADLHAAPQHPVFDDPNNQSLILRLESNGFSFLFPGDIERETEKKLLAAQRNLDSDVLLAPHHGSGTSGSRAFLDRVSPDVIVISSGKHEEAAYDQWETTLKKGRNRPRVFKTAKDGTITITTEGPELSVRTFYPTDGKPAF